MVKRKSILANSVAALYLLLDTKYRQGYFYVEYSDGKQCESFDNLNEAIKRYDEITESLRQRSLNLLEARAGKLHGSYLVGAHKGSRQSS